MAEVRIDYESVRRRAQAAVDAGQLQEAERIIEAFCTWAREHGDSSELDSAVCGLAAIAIHLRRGEGEIPRLQEILLRSDPANCRLAAYNISKHYQYAKNYKKSLFYARLARDRAEKLGRADWLAYCHNQVGNALLGECSVEAASRAYEKALELMPESGSIWRSWTLTNLGYCRTLEGRFDEAYRLLYESLTILRRSGAEVHQVTTRIDLCFIHLETGRYRHARRHGLAALVLAEKSGVDDDVKNALYLLGEAAHLSGDTATALEYFSRLQRDFFPGASYLPSFLLAVDVRKLVNLHA